MSIRIREHSCTGCGACTRVCPGRLLEMAESGRVHMPEPRDCWGCGACIKACRFEALEYRLGADIGGLGTTLQVHGDPEQLHWIFTRPNGEKKIITINRKDPNSY